MEEDLPRYTFGSTPYVLIKEACQKRFGEDAPCNFYHKGIETIEGERAEVHRCSGPSTCDYMMDIALILSDSRSELHKRVFAED